MRRHPVAVYRVIDEEELLGGEDFELASRRAPAGGGAPAPALRPQRRRWGGWGSTALGVVVLACIAGLLLEVSPRARAPVQSRRAGTATFADRVLGIAGSARLTTPRRPLPRRLPGRTRSVIVRRPERARGRRLVGTLTRQSGVVVEPRGGVAMTPPRSAPEREFGFER